MTHGLKVILSPLVWVSLLSAETATRMIPNAMAKSKLFAELSETHITEEVHFVRV